MAAANDARLAHQVGRERPAALVANADAIWRRQLGPLLSAQNVQHRLGVASLQEVHERAKCQRLLELPTRSGSFMYPAFSARRLSPSIVFTARSAIPGGSRTTALDDSTWGRPTAPPTWPSVPLVAWSRSYATSLSYPRSFSRDEGFPPFSYLPPCG